MKPPHHPPDEENRELLIHRMVSFLPMFFFILILIVYFIWLGAISSPSFYEVDLTVPTARFGPSPAPTDVPPIQITDDGIVTFGVLRLPRSDRSLDALVLRLRRIAPHTSRQHPLILRPDPATNLQRFVDVLSAIQRSGIRDYSLP